MTNLSIFIPFFLRRKKTNSNRMCLHRMVGIRIDELDTVLVLFFLFESNNKFRQNLRKTYIQNGIVSAMISIPKQTFMVANKNQNLYY